MCELLFSVAALTVLVVLAMVHAPASHADTGPIGVDAMTDIPALPVLRSGVWMVGTDSHDVTGGNDDGFQANYSYLYKDDDEWVLFEEEGPGCVYVVRTILHKSKLNVYLDGATEPTHEFNFEDMYWAKEVPFEKPFVDHEKEAHGSSWAYVPITFSKGCKLTTDEMEKPHFYNIFAHKLAAGTEVEPFDPSKSLTDALKYWRDPAKAAPTTPGTRQHTGKQSIAPRAQVDILDIAGAGAITSLKLKIPGGRNAMADLVLRGYWDGRADASIDSPVGSFFVQGCPRALKAVDNAVPELLDTPRYLGGVMPAKSLLVGEGDDGWLYCHFPMPYWRSAKLILMNVSATDTIEVEYDIAQIEQPYPLDEVSQKAFADTQDERDALDTRAAEAQKRINELIQAFSTVDREDREKLDAMGKEHGALLQEVAASHAKWLSLSGMGATGYFYAKWRRDTEVGEGEDFRILDTRGRGHFMGCIVTFKSVQRLADDPKTWSRSYLEGDARFYVDDTRTPIVASTGTEEYFNWGWYDLRPMDEIFEYPTHGYPLHVVEDQDYTVMYRIHLTDLVPYYRSFRFDLEHGPIGRTPADYSVTAFYYQQDTPQLVLTDELDIGDADSEEAHDYACDGAVGEERRTIPYEGSYQLPLVGDSPRDREHVVKDTGRVWSGSCAFTAKVAKDNDGVKVRRRSYYGFGSDGSLGPIRPEPTLTKPQRVAVSVDGVDVGDWYLPAGHARDSWRDTDFEIPASFTNGKESVTVKLTAKDGSEWDEYTYWVYTYQAKS